MYNYFTSLSIGNGFAIYERSRPCFKDKFPYRNYNMTLKTKLLYNSGMSVCHTS